MDGKCGSKSPGSPGRRKQMWGEMKSSILAMLNLRYLI